jgi:oligopeptide transport system substrate-binding protein
MKMRNLIIASIMAITSLGLVSCSDKDNGKKDRLTTINIDLGSDAATLDPQMSEDVQSVRVIYDLFEGLTSQDQHNHTSPGLAYKWEISADNKTYTFHLRPNLKFSDGSPLTAADVVFSYQRLADPKTASPYNFLVSNLENGQAIVDAKLPPAQLGIQAVDDHTVRIRLTNPDPSFLSIVAQPDLAVVSKANLSKFGSAWTEPKNMVTSGAYKLDERVVQGYILASKNPYYYDAGNVAIERVKYFPIVDTNASLSQYKTGSIDVTYMLPIDQYKTIKAQMPDQEHTVLWEAIEYYDFNMNLPKYKDNPKLRQALVMAVDREALVKEVMGQDQKSLYTYASSTIEGGKFAGLDYEWAGWPRDKQIAVARQLFREAGYGPNHPLQVTITYNTRDYTKKNSLAIASMWQQVFGSGSIQTVASNQEWKTFLQARHTGSYDIARDGWVADYDSVDSYTALYQCGNPQNNAHDCIKGYNDLLNQAQNTSDPQLRVKLIRQALTLAMNDYSRIPLYQLTYYRLVNPRVKNYDIENNHLDHVMTKWFQLIE